MRQPLKHAALALLLALQSQAALAETKLLPWKKEGNAKRPYIFTQQHNMPDIAKAKDRVQLIRLGYPLQVQLPGNPALWTFQKEASQNVEYRGRTMVYSPDRIAGTQSLLVFDLALSPDAQDGSEGFFTFTTKQLPNSLSSVIPGGVYVVYFKVIDPG